MSRSEIKRVIRICEFLEKNVSYQEIQQRLTPLNSQEIGNKSVENVQKALQSFSFIEKIEKTIQNSQEDTVDKYDLIISLSGKNVDTIGIQVKSSFRNVSKFCNKLSNNCNEVEKILTKRKIIVINGQLQDHIIKKIFTKKLSKIDQYYQSLPCQREI